MSLSHRRGMSMVIVLILFFILVGAGLYIFSLARQAGRASHWYHHSQLAFGLADAGLKQTLYLLSQYNSPGKATGAPQLSGPLKQVADALTGAGAGSGPIKIFSSDDAVSSLPLSIVEHLSSLNGYSPSLKVEVTVGPGQPLWNGFISGSGGGGDGIPANPKEKLGPITITALASVQPLTGPRVSRVITMEREYKVVSLLPPLVGRFSLLVGSSGNQDPNFVQLQLNPADGDSTLSGGAEPLVIRSETSIPLTRPGENALSRSEFVNQLKDLEFLDKQGWIFLGGAGGASGGGRWDLKLPHGFGKYGETPFLPGDVQHVTYKDTQSEDDQMKKRFEDNWPPASGKVAVLAQNTAAGLWQLHHGFAKFEEYIGVDPSKWTFATDKIAFPGEDISSSGLRLMGTPDSMSPTLVFGPVYRKFIQRGTILASLAPATPPPGPLVIETLRFNLWSWDKLTPAAIQTFLQTVFGSKADYEEWATNVITNEPYLQSLNCVLSHRGEGKYAFNGVLLRQIDKGNPKQFTSKLLANFPKIPDDKGFPEAFGRSMLEGKLDAPEVYKGSLYGGLAAFSAALDKKLTFELSAEAFKTVVLDKDVLRLPGNIYVPGGLTLPRIAKVEPGGILYTDGDIKIEGDITRGSGSEPLTLVTNGNIEIASGVKLLGVYLVAKGPDSKVKIQSPEIRILGGIACTQLDLDALKSGVGQRLILHVRDMDPLGPNQASALRAFYGGVPRISVSGGG